MEKSNMYPTYTTERGISSDFGSFLHSSLYWMFARSMYISVVTVAEFQSEAGELQHFFAPQ